MISIDDVKNGYEKISQVKRYSEAARTIGLWGSEKIIFTNYFNKNQSILDIGCGAGRTTIGLAKLGFSKIEGLDLSHNLIEIAKQIAFEEGLKNKFICANTLDLPFRNNKFDGAIFSFNGIMQIPNKINRLKAMIEINRIIKPSTYFIFTTHSGREETGLFLKYWQEYKKNWESSKRDKRLIDYGDRFFKMDEIEMFIHIPTREEVEDLINESKFKLICSNLRSEICEENQRVMNYSTDCRFWITQK